MPRIGNTGRWKDARSALGVARRRRVEHLTFDRSSGGIVVESAVVGQRYGRAYRLAYRVECDAHWHVTHAVLKVMGGGTLELRGDGAGHWRDGSGRALPELDGCIDIDIAATPFTNSLPIGRLELRAR